MSELFRARDTRYQWLEEHRQGWQFGEQGVLLALAQSVGISHAFEIGAGDGEGLPLTIAPLYDCGIHCTLFEADPESREKLRQKYPNATVNGIFELDAKPIESLKDSLCIIDVDGIDVLILKDILRAGYLPEVLMVEHYDLCGPYMGPGAPGPEDVPPWLLGMPVSNGFIIQATSRNLAKIAGQFGYSLVGTSRVNSLFVLEGNCV